MSELSKEARINLAITAIRSTDNLSCRKAARMYNVSKDTLTARMAGRLPPNATELRNRKLTTLEEDVVVQYVLELDSRGYPPCFSAVEDMANHILCTKGLPYIGKNWVYRFIQRRPELKGRFTRVYDLQRALCEDPELISKWFTLFKNICDKYGILDSDIWNFDETGFMMGIITPYMVVTKAERLGKAKAVQPGNRDWATAIIAASAKGDIIPPYVLVKGVMA
jgi:transposase